MKKKTKIIIAAAAVVVLVAGIFVVRYFMRPYSPENYGKVEAKAVEFIASYDIVDHYAADINRFRGRVSGEFGMGPETVDFFCGQPEEWLSYRLEILLTNTTADVANFTALDVPGNGKDGVYLRTVLDDGVGVAPGGEISFFVDILCSNGELSDDEVRAIFNNMDISVLYTTSEYGAPESIKLTKVTA